MITRCDHCGSIFEVSDELVYSADPGVRCGECMSLFDARANLYNKAEFRKVTDEFKPVQTNSEKASRVQTNKRAATRLTESADSAFLETADTVAVEHTYGNAGIAAADSTASADGNKPDIDLARTRNEYRPYSADDEYPQDMEFERTIATDSSLPERVGSSDYLSDSEMSRLPADLSDSEDEAGDYNNLDSTETLSPEQRPGQRSEQTASDKQQAMREREQRALQVEPERDFESTTLDHETDLDARGFDREQLRQVQEFRARNDDRQRPDSREGNRRGMQSRPRPRIDDRHLARDTQRRDHSFIPDDVLEKSSVHRDNGRRGDDLHFSADTPRFDTAPRSRAPDTSRPSQVRNRRRDSRESDELRAGYDNTSAKRTESRRPKRTEASVDSRGPERVTASDSTDDLHSSELQYLRRRSMDHDESAIRDESPVVADTSAQEMRRYQHYRPSVDASVDAGEADDLLVKQGSKTKRRRGVGVTSILWLLGLCAAVCLLLFAARNVVANMNLPEPLITSFCQITGCVPAAAKKDASQLQTMRKRLYTHPEIEDALVISVDVVNNSVYKQPYPTLAVTLLDTEGETIAERDFQSTDYEVVDGSEAGFLMPGEPTRIKIEVVDTGLGAKEVNLAYE